MAGHRHAIILLVLAVAVAAPSLATGKRIIPACGSSGCEGNNCILCAHCATCAKAVRASTKTKIVTIDAT